MITTEEIESYGKAIAKITVRHRWAEQPSDASIEQQDNFDMKRSSFNRRLLRYTFPEHVAYKFEAVKDGEDPSKILSIPATWVVAANAIGNISKIHTWDHAAVYLSGHELLPDTLEKLRSFSLHGEEQGRRIPWFISHLATNASILSLGNQPHQAGDTETKKEAGSKKRASSRNPPTPPTPRREARARVTASPRARALPTRRREVSTIEMSADGRTPLFRGGDGRTMSTDGATEDIGDDGAPERGARDAGDCDPGESYGSLVNVLRMTIRFSLE